MTRTVSRRPKKRTNPHLLHRSTITVVEPTIDEQRYAPHQVRMAALERDGFKCRYCGASVTNETANMDHVIPWKKGGKSVTLNLVTACRGCNKEKGNSHWVPNPQDSRYRTLLTKHKKTIFICKRCNVQVNVETADQHWSKHHSQ